MKGTIDEDDTRNTKSVDRGTVAPAAKKAPNEDNRPQTDNDDAKQEGRHAGDTKSEKENVFHTLPEHAVNCTGRHVGKGNNRKYVAR